MAVPMMMGHYLPNGLLGLGLTALMASFMSGMAGNVTAFNTVLTYDLYQSHIAPDRSDAHYLWVGRVTTVVGIALEHRRRLLRHAVQQHHGPAAARVRRSSTPRCSPRSCWACSGSGPTGHGAFSGLVAGTLAGLAHFGLTQPADSTSLFNGGWLIGPQLVPPRRLHGLHVLHKYQSVMALSFWTAIWAFVVVPRGDDRGLALDPAAEVGRGAARAGLFAHAAARAGPQPVLVREAGRLGGLRAGQA